MEFIWILAYGLLFLKLKDVYLVVGIVIFDVYCATHNPMFIVGRDELDRSNLALDGGEYLRAKSVCVC